MVHSGSFNHTSKLIIPDTFVPNRLGTWLVGASCNGLGVMVNMLGVPLPECQYHDKEPEHKDDCRIVVHLKLLFGLIFLHGFVPDDFGSGIIVHLCP